MIDRKRKGGPENEGEGGIVERREIGVRWGEELNEEMREDLKEE